MMMKMEEREEEEQEEEGGRRTWRRRRGGRRIRRRTGRRRRWRRGKRRSKVCVSVWSNADKPLRRLTVEGSIPHPLGDDFSWRPLVRRRPHRQGFIQSVSVEHQPVVKASSYDVHLQTKTEQITSSIRILSVSITPACCCFYHTSPTFGLQRTSCMETFHPTNNLRSSHQPEGKCDPATRSEWRAWNQNEWLMTLAKHSI